MSKGSGPLSRKLDHRIREITNHFLLKPDDIARIGAVILATNPAEEDLSTAAEEMWREAKRAARPHLRDLATLVEPVARLDHRSYRRRPGSFWKRSSFERRTVEK